MPVIDAVNLSHSYDDSGTLPLSLDHISFSVKSGELTVFLGRNGCGKSTLARHLNALLPVQSGELFVAGLNARSQANIWRIRQACGMVFQNPDNQFVSSIVEEDLAFGLDNYDVSPEEIPERIRKVLKTVGMEGYEKKSPHMLSGGQKQRIAIAGVLAVNPDILIFDEVTSMLDPDGRREVLSTINRLHESEKKTILMITHYIEEAVFADRIFLMLDGTLLREGTPREILTDRDLLARAGLTPPFTVQAYYDLREAGVSLPFCPLTRKELVNQLCQLH